jgi:hypothetical protein
MVREPNKLIKIEFRVVIVIVFPFFLKTKYLDAFQPWLHNHYQSGFYVN